MSIPCLEVVMSESPEHQHKPIRSQFADDPEMADLVEMFVSEMPSRIEALQEAWTSGELARLAVLTQRLGGSCSGYGFPSVSVAALRLGQRLADAEVQEMDQLSSLQQEFEALLKICLQACGTPPNL
jgi:HPt (histidine-containing phosphotransfer) domain-containing protein